MSFRFHWIILLTLTACKHVTMSRLSATSESATVNFEFDNALNRKFQGVGVQWDPLDHDVGDYSDADWDLAFKRLTFARPTLMRVMVNPYFYYKESTDGSRSAYVWDPEQHPDLKFSVQYPQLLKILQFAQKQDISVFFGQWFGLSPKAPYESTASLNRLLDLFERLIEVEKFNNIKYLSIVNEPDGWWTYGDKPTSGHEGNPVYWSRWETAARNLQSALSQRSFAQNLLVSGPACDVEFDWIPRTMQQFGRSFGAYDFHTYTEDQRIANGEIEAEWVNRIGSWASKVSPAELDKPLLVTEFGRNDGKNTKTDEQTEVGTFLHGVKMADFVAQFIRAGIDGLVIYALDDRMHIHEPSWQANPDVKVFKRWGLWSTVPSDPPNARQSRPWFYPMSLAMRYFPRDATILRSSGTNLQGLRYVAARTGSNGEHIAMMLVNNNQATRQLNVKVAGLNRAINLSVFNYFDGQNLFDNDGIPQRSANYVGRNLANGIEVVLPPHSVVVLASEDAENVEKGENQPKPAAGNGSDCGIANEDGLTCEQAGIAPGQIKEQWGQRWECYNGCARVINSQNMNPRNPGNPCQFANQDGLTCEQAGILPGQIKEQWGQRWECYNGCARVVPQ